MNYIKYLQLTTRVIQWPVFKVGRDFKRFVGFDVYTRYTMLKTLLDDGISFDEFARRLGWKRSRVDKTILRENLDIQLSDVALWFHALGKEMKLR